MPDWNRRFRFAALLILGGIPTLAIVAALGASGFALSVAGLVLLFAGHAAAAQALPWWITLDTDPRLAMIAGPFIAVIGFSCLMLLALYLRLATRVVNRVLPPRNA
jgi:hypothetical protein